MGPSDCLHALAVGELAASQALERAQLALDGANPDAAWALPAAIALWQLERYGEAHELCTTYPEEFDRTASGLMLKGMVARRIPGQETVAEAALRRSIELEPHKPESHYNLGNLLTALERYAEAADAYRTSLNIDAGVASAWHNYGIALRELDRYAEARQAMRQSIRLDPHNPDVWCNLGLVEHSLERFEKAMVYYRHAISIDSNHSTSWLNTAQSLLEEQKPEEALNYLLQGSRIQPTSADSLFNLALTQLLLGNFQEGWPLYETRFRTKQFSDTQVPSSGPWIRSFTELTETISSGSDLLVWSEQGLGDAIQFIRYLSILRNLGARLTFCTRPPLVPLFQQWFEEPITIIDENKLTAEMRQRPHLALLSLPALLRTNLATIPCETPYLRPPGPPTEQELVIKPPGGLAVGLVWASNRGNKAMYRKKSMPLDCLMPKLLPAVKNNLLELHCLQVGADADELTPWENIPGIHNWNGKLNDFAATASVVQQLDLMISVDTAVAHLAGAMDIPTWLLLASSADFRWLHQRSDSPWYRTMRLFRQPAPSNWPGLTNQVVDCLGEVLGLDLARLSELDS